MTTSLLLVGVLLIFGGEAFCVFGPHTRLVDVGCHAVLYAGIVLAALGAVLEGRRRFRRPLKPLGGE